MRGALAIVLAFAVPLNAETVDPLWYLLSTQFLARDEKAVAAPGEDGVDSQKLAGLQSDLQLLADGFESFRDEAQVKETLGRLESRIAPSLRPFFETRASSLNAIYRTLSVTDYTWSLRFPEPPCEPAEARSKLLRSRDGLFQNEAGVASPWLVSLLGPAAEGKSAAQALDQASSAVMPSPAEYERRRAQVRRLTLALASEKAVGAARAKLYCARAAAFADLAAYHRPHEGEPVQASRSASHADPQQSVFVVVGNGRRAAATLVQTKDGPILLTDASIVRDPEHARLIAFPGNSQSAELIAVVSRRDDGIGLAVLKIPEEISRSGLLLADKTAMKDELVSAIGHSEMSGLWTKTSGLVTQVGSDAFQTDAAVAADFSGGPVLNDAGEVAGLLVLRPADTEEGRWPVAVPAPTIVRWIDGATILGAPAVEKIEDGGTAAVLSRSRPSLLTETGFDPAVIRSLPPPPASPPGVCVAYCDDPAPRRSHTAYTNPHSDFGSSSYSDNGSAELGQALGQLGAVLILKGIPALFRGISKLFKRKDGSTTKREEPKIVDNRHRVLAEPPKEVPKPPPDPLKPSALAMKVSRSSLAQGEEIEAVATVSFTGKDGSIAGHAVSFSVVPAGKLTCPPGRTDSAGIARVTCQATIIETDRNFDDLQDETRRRMGMKTLGRVRRKVAKGDKIAELKERQAAAIDQLVIEEEKNPLTGSDTPGLFGEHPNIGTDTPGLDEVHPPRGTDTPGLFKPIELEVTGDRVILGASLENLAEHSTIVILERPCPSGVSACSGVAPIKCHCKSLGDGGGKVYSSAEEETPSDENTNNPRPIPPNLPPGAVENPDRPGSWGEYDESGKFRERWRIDRGQPGKPGWRGEDHVHINGEEEHLPPNTPYP